MFKPKEGEDEKRLALRDRLNKAGLYASNICPDCRDWKQLCPVPHPPRYPYRLEGITGSTPPIWGKDEEMYIRELKKAYNQSVKEMNSYLDELSKFDIFLV